MKCKYCGQEGKKAGMYHISHGLNIHFISEDIVEYMCGDCYFELMVYISKFKKPNINKETDRSNARKACLIEKNILNKLKDENIRNKFIDMYYEHRNTVNITDDDMDYQYTLMCIEDELDSIKERYGLDKKGMQQLVGELND